MPSLLGTTVTANYLKTSPSTNFGTRQLRIININAGTAGDSDIDLTRQAYIVTGATSGTYTGSYTDSDSYYSAAVRAIQTVAEIYAIGQPTATDFIAVVAYDTANDSGSTAGSQNVQDKSWGDLETAISDALTARLGNKTPVGSAGFVYNGTVSVTAIDVAAGVNNFAGSVVNTLS